MQSELTLEVHTANHTRAVDALSADRGVALTLLGQCFLELIIVVL